MTTPVTLVVEHGPAGVVVRLSDTVIAGPKPVVGTGNVVSFVVDLETIAKALGPLLEEDP